MLSKCSGLTMQYNTNSNGTPISIYIKGEVKQISISHNLIQLEQIPDEFYRLQIVDSNGNKMYEVFDNSDINDELAYKVNYAYGIVYFHPNKSGEQITITYYGRGLQLIHFSRIVMDNGTMLNELVNEIVEIKNKNIATTSIDSDDLDELKTELKAIKEQVLLLQKQNNLLVDAIAKLERGDN